MPEDKKVLNFKTASAKADAKRDNSQGTQFGIGNFFQWAMTKYPQLTLGQLQTKMPGLEREYSQEKTMRKQEPNMVPSVNPHEDVNGLNRLRKLSGLEEKTIQEERSVVGCTEDQSFYIFVNGKELRLGKTPEEIANELQHSGADIDDMYYSSSMDFATECGFETDDSAKGIMDQAIAIWKPESMQEAKYKQCKSCKGKGCDHCGGTGKHAIKEDSVEKDVIGHVDNEADMLRKELFKMGKYSVDLYKMLDKLPDGDFPHWWQAKIVKAGEYLSSAKHYLDGELHAPEEESPLDTDQEQELQDINPSGV